MLLLLCAGAQMHAQLQAGDTDNVVYTPVGVNLQLLFNPPNTFDVLSDSIDVDGDGVDDLSFNITLSNVPDFGGSVADVAVLQPHVEIMTTNYLVTQLQIGENILPDSSWTNSLSWTLAANFNGLIGPTAYGEWLNTNSGYLAFRVIQPNDTLYGWSDIYAQATMDSVKLKVSGFALETVINGSKDIATKNLAVFPNPVSESLTIPHADYSRIEVYSTNGQLVKALEGQSFDRIDLSGLAPGLYHLVMYKGDARWLGKVVKQ